MRKTSTLLWILLFVLSAGAARAGEDDAAALSFLHLNEQGTEAWVRVVDGAVVLRVPGGAYLHRPYEGWEAIEEPTAVEVPSFFVDRCEITNEQFARFLNATHDVSGLVANDVPGLVPPKAEDETGRWSASPGMAQHPVTAATGAGALAYAQWVGGRLPTPDEWAKAAGGPGGRLFPWGDEPPNARLANFGRPQPRGLMPVGSFAAGASPYGAVDMAGNAYERVWAVVQGGGRVPVMLKGGSWLTRHPLNLRVLDMCMQPMDVAEISVGFRVVMDDPEPDRPTHTVPDASRLKLARSWEGAIREAKRRRVPLFLSLQYDTCGQCDRTRVQCFTDPRFVAYCNEHLVVVVGHQPGDGFENPHPEGDDGSCPVYPGLTCTEHEILFFKGLEVVERFAVSPGMFVLHPDRVEPGAGRAAILVGEGAFPKWGNAVDAYLAAFEQARRRMADDEE